MNFNWAPLRWSLYVLWLGAQENAVRIVAQHILVYTWKIDSHKSSYLLGWIQ